MALNLTVFNALLIVQMHFGWYRVISDDNPKFAKKAP